MPPEATLKTILARDLAADVVTRLESARKAITAIQNASPADAAEANVHIQNAGLNLDTTLASLRAVQEIFS
jgi:hypothetical protein